jgi:hypothetical protein
MTYAGFNTANHSFRPTVVTESSLDMGFCRDIVASDNTLPGSILCNLATVSKFRVFFDKSMHNML